MYNSRCPESLGILLLPSFCWRYETEELIWGINSVPFSNLIAVLVLWAVQFVPFTVLSNSVSRTIYCRLSMCIESLMNYGNVLWKPDLFLCLYWDFPVVLFSFAFMLKAENSHFKYCEFYPAIWKLILKNKKQIFPAAKKWHRCY